MSDYLTAKQSYSNDQVYSNKLRPRLKLRLLPNKKNVSIKIKYLNLIANIFNTQRGEEFSLHQIMQKSRLTKSQTMLALQTLIDQNKIQAKYTKGRMVFFDACFK